jgi:hypothetical protein
MAFPVFAFSDGVSIQQVAGDMLKILVADAVIVEPVSTPKFPANITGILTGNFVKSARIVRF